MQKMMATLPEDTEKKRTPLADKRHFTHKRMDRWIRLQQFVYGLPDEYSYAICQKDGERFESHALVSVGWMNWYGYGMGADRQHGLAVALLGTNEALSANTTATLLHRIGKFLRFRRRAKPQARLGLENGLAGELLAG